MQIITITLSFYNRATHCWQLAGTSTFVDNCSRILDFLSALKIIRLVTPKTYLRRRKSKEDILYLIINSLLAGNKTRILILYVGRIV